MKGQTKTTAKGGKTAKRKAPAKTAVKTKGRKIQGASAGADKLHVLNAKVRARFVKTCEMQNLDPIKTLNRAAGNFNEFFA